MAEAVFLALARIFPVKALLKYEGNHVSVFYFRQPLRNFTLEGGIRGEKVLPVFEKERKEIEKPKLSCKKAVIAIGIRFLLQTTHEKFYIRGQENSRGS